MSRYLGVPDASRTPSAPSLAVRAVAPGWRDPRLWLGVALVAVCVVAGARLLAAADDSVAVWALSSDIGPGGEVDEDDLVPVRVRFADAADRGRYHLVEDPLPSGHRLSRAVGEGELLPRGALAPPREADLVQVRIAVDDEQVPASVAAGSLVHVYLLPASRDRLGAASAGHPTLERVTVVDAPPLEDSFTTTGNRTVDVVVGEDDARAYLARRAELGDPVVTVVEVGP